MDFQKKANAIIDGLVKRDPDNLEYIQSRRDIMMNRAANLQNLRRFDESVAVFRTAIDLYRNSPLVKDKPAEIAYYEGLLNERLGNVFKDQADKNAALRPAKLRAAADAFRKAITIWERPLVSEAFFATNTEQIDAAKKKLAECE